MTNSTEPAFVPGDPAAPLTDRLRLAVAAYLGRFKGSSREHTESDLRCYLSWCAERGLDPLAARRLHLELYIRWMQEIRRFRPSTVSRRFSVTAGFYRTCLREPGGERAQPALVTARQDRARPAGDHRLRGQRTGIPRGPVQHDPARHDINLSGAGATPAGRRLDQDAA
jgi:hypothetical protein